MYLTLIQNRKSTSLKLVGGRICSNNHLRRWDESIHSFRPQHIIIQVCGNRVADMVRAREAVELKMR